MRLTDVDIQRSKVYVVVEGHTYRYGVVILCRFGEYKVSMLSIVNGYVYITLEE